MKKSSEDYKHLKKVSTIAKMYKKGVSTSYIYKLQAEGKIDFITIDDVHFIDLSSLSEEIKKNLKK
jgi:hypothetical protein